MSDMYEQANKINTELKELHQILVSSNFNYVDEQKVFIKKVLTTMIRFGQTAKFRCRSNTAYDNFVNACFADIAKTERRKPENLDFEILEVQEVL